MQVVYTNHALNRFGQRVGKSKLPKRLDVPLNESECIIHLNNQPYRLCYVIENSIIVVKTIMKDNPKYAQKYSQRLVEKKESPIAKALAEFRPKNL